MITAEEFACRRKYILDNYAITIENVDYDEWMDIVLSDSRLNTHWGQPMANYIMKELDEVVVHGS